MRPVYILLLLAMCVSTVRSDAANGDLFKQLNEVLANKEQYVNQKEQTIKQLERRLATESNLNSKFNIYKALYNEYKSFRYDSAYSYSKKLEVTAKLLHDPVKMAISKMSVSFTLLSSGLFKETAETLGQINVALLNRDEKLEYFFLKGRCYFDWGDFNHNSDYSEVYYPKALACIDSALAISDKNSFYYWSLNGLKNLRIQNYAESATDYKNLLKIPNLTYNQFAVAASSLSYVYSVQGKREEATALMIRAAIADLKSATKETVAMYELARILYETKDQDNAFLYINEAMDEATFYGARHRQVTISSILPIIEAQRIKSVEDERRSLLIYASIITVLVMFVIAFAVIINRQLKKIRKADEIIKAANHSLQDSNKALEEVNRNLSTANKIKNEYITYYFNVNSVYIDKLESIKKSLEKKMKSQRYEDALDTLKKLNLESERHELFHTFDRVFLRLFPDFMVRFNALFKDEDRVCVPEGQLLSTEHRIFCAYPNGDSR